MVNGLPRLIATATVVVLLVPACAPETTADAESSSYSVRDSAGIRIVENHAPTWQTAEGWSIAPEPSTEIGSAEGDPEYMLFSVSDALRMPDGRIVVVNNGSREVRFYDSTGRYLDALGGEGEGPGEFRAPWRVRRLEGDTLVVWDMGYPGSLSFFDEAANYVDRSTIDRARLSVAMPQWFAEGGELLPDGTFLLHLFKQEAPNMGRVGRYRSAGGWILSPVDVSRVDTVGFFLGREQFGYEYDGQVSSNGLQYGLNTFVTGGGAPVRIYVADSGQYEIRVFSSRGVIETIIRRSQEPIPVTEDEIREAADQYRQRLDQVPEEYRARLSAYLEVVEYPETKPALGTMKVDTEGNLWVMDTEKVDDHPAMSVFNPNGEWLGQVVLPTYVQIFEIGPNYVLGMRRNEFGIETVVLYELHKAAG